MKNFKPCRLTFEGRRYQIDARALVSEISATTGDFIQFAADQTAIKVRCDASRRRRNRASRERYDGMRSLGLVRTAGGWE